jgi:hypothetical protein
MASDLGLTGRGLPGLHRATSQFARRGLGQGTGHGSTLNLRGTQRIQPMGSGQLPQDGQE